MQPFWLNDLSSVGDSVFRSGFEKSIIYYEKINNLTC